MGPNGLADAGKCVMENQERWGGGEEERNGGEKRGEQRLVNKRERESSIGSTFWSDDLSHDHFWPPPLPPPSLPSSDLSGSEPFGGYLCRPPSWRRALAPKQQRVFTT